MIRPDRSGKLEPSDALHVVHANVRRLEHELRLALGIADDIGDRLRIGSRLEQQDLPGGVLGQARRDDAAGRPAADDDDVVA